MQKPSPAFQGALVIGVNLASFILYADLSERMTWHHHWVLPFSSLLLLIEAALLEFLAPKAYPTLRRNILITLACVTTIGLARFQTIFACFDHCYFKLASMQGIALAALILPLAFKRKLDSPWPAPWALVLTGLWALTRGFRYAP